MTIRKILKRLLMLFLSLLILSCASTEGLHKNTTELLEEMDWRFDTISISEMKASADIQVHDRYYLVDEATEALWSRYVDVDPSSLWKGPMLNFEGVYNPLDETFYTKTDADVPVLSEGQIVFLDLVIEHMLHHPTSFMITDIDNVQHQLVFNYTDINTASGKQQISLIEMEFEDGNKTLIRHRAWYRNESGLRNRLYPVYHEQALDEFHQRVAKTNGYSLKIYSAKNAQKKGLIP